MRCELRRRPADGRVFLLIPLAACAAALLLAVDALLPLGLPGGCPFKGVTGFPCLSCGMTRAALRLLAGDLAGAFSFHPLGTGGILFAALSGGLAATARGAGFQLRLRFTPAEKGFCLFLTGHLVLVHWLYAIQRGI